MTCNWATMLNNLLAMQVVFQQFQLLSRAAFCGGKSTSMCPPGSIPRVAKLEQNQSLIGSATLADSR